MRYHTSLLALFLVLMLAGCDTGGDDPPTVQGRFEGTLAYSVLEEMFEETWLLNLTENARSEVSGDGVLGVDVVTVSGMHDHPDVTLTFFDRFDAQTGIFTGTLSDDGRVLEGVFNFSIIFVDVPIALRRQDVQILLRRVAVR